MMNNKKDGVSENAKLTREIKDSAVSFDSLGIKESILGVIKKMGFTTPTPIQEKTIPIGIDGQDLIGVAQTGTGKTYAFGIPMLQRLGENNGQGLVLLPTRELALQVNESLKQLGGMLGLRTAALIGGEPIDRQLFALRKRPHIIVGTPGRIIDHLKRKTLKFDNVKVLVLDEADMMFDMGFAPQVNEILDKVPKDRQTMLFSATMPPAILKLVATHMKLPVHIETAPQGTAAENVDQEIYIMKGEDKFKYLEETLLQFPGSVLIFVRTKQAVKTMTQKMKVIGYKVAEIHSDLSFSRRREALAGFKTGKYRILIGTDVAARGLDVNGIELVVNYNLPDNSEDYVHRIGRTGRAGKKGKAISFAMPSQRREIQEIERLINKSIPSKMLTKAEAPTNYSKPLGFLGKKREKEQRRGYGNNNFSKPKYSFNGPEKVFEAKDYKKSYVDKQKPYKKTSFEFKKTGVNSVKVGGGFGKSARNFSKNEFGVDDLLGSFGGRKKPALKQSGGFKPGAKKRFGKFSK